MPVVWEPHSFSIKLSWIKISLCPKQGRVSARSSFKIFPVMSPNDVAKHIKMKILNFLSNRSKSLQEEQESMQTTL